MITKTSRPIVFPETYTREEWCNFRIYGEVELKDNKLLHV